MRHSGSTSSLQHSAKELIIYHQSLGDPNATIGSVSCSSTTIFTPSYIAFEARSCLRFWVRSVYTTGSIQKHRSRSKSVEITGHALRHLRLMLNKKPPSPSRIPSGDSESATALSSLPYDLLLNIATFLDLRDVHALHLVSIRISCGLCQAAMRFDIQLTPSYNY